MRQRLAGFQRINKIMEINKELAVVKKQVIGANEAAQGLTINSQPKLEEAKIVLNKIGVVKKYLKGDKDGIIKPIKESIKKIEAKYTPLEEMIDEAERIVKGKMLAYNRILQAEEEKRRLALEEEAKKKRVDEVKVEKAVEKVEAIIEKREAIPTRKNKVIEIIDENKIPDRYWQLNMVKIREDAITNGIEIEGVKVVIEEVIVNR